MVRVLELFAGIGAFSKALERSGIEHEIVDAVEIDKFAIASFNAIHGTNFQPQDITKWDKDVGHVDVILHGSPCQDFSFAGLGRGGDEGSGTRSSLMYESLRIIDKVQPRIVIWENVKAVLSKNHRHNFDRYSEVMEHMGYTNYYQVLNAKDYGTPQNRERVFTVSVKDSVQDFTFPTPIPLEKRLKDILEPVVAESFYLSDEQVKKIKMTTFHQAQSRIQEGDISQTLCARDWKDPKCVKVGDLDIKGQDCLKRVYSPEGVSPTLTTMGGGNREPKIIDDTYANRDARVYAEYSPALRSERSGLKVTEPFIAASRGRNPENPSDRTTGAPTEQRLEPKFDGTANTLTSVQKDNYVVEPRLGFVGGIGEKDWAKDGKGLSRNYPQGARVYSANGVSATLSSQGVGGVGGYSGNYQLPNMSVRKLTPKECWRLMGFDDADYEKASKVNSKTQLYKQAGNSIVVNVLEAIIKQLPLT